MNSQTIPTIPLSLSLSLSPQSFRCRGQPCIKSRGASRMARAYARFTRRRARIRRERGMSTRTIHPDALLAPQSYDKRNAAISSRKLMIRTRRAPARDLSRSFFLSRSRERDLVLDLFSSSLSFSLSVSRSWAEILKTISPSRGSRALILARGALRFRALNTKREKEGKEPFSLSLSLSLSLSPSPRDDANEASVSEYQSYYGERRKSTYALRKTGMCEGDEGGCG